MRRNGNREPLIGDVMLVYYVLHQGAVGDVALVNHNYVKRIFDGGYTDCEERIRKQWKNQTVTLNDHMFRSVYGTEEIARLKRMVMDVDFICYLKYFDVCFFFRLFFIFFLFLQMTVKQFRRGVIGNLQHLYSILLMLENILCTNDWADVDGCLVYESIENVRANYPIKAHVQDFPNFAQWGKKEKKKMKKWCQVIGVVLRSNDDFLLGDKYSIVLQSILFQLNVTDFNLDFVCFFICLFFFCL